MPSPLLPLLLIGGAGAALLLLTKQSTPASAPAPTVGTKAPTPPKVDPVQCQGATQGLQAAYCAYLAASQTTNAQNIATTKAKYEALAKAWPPACGTIPQATRYSCPAAGQGAVSQASQDAYNKALAAQSVGNYQALVNANYQAALAAQSGGNYQALQGAQRTPGVETSQGTPTDWSPYGAQASALELLQVQAASAAWVTWLSQNPGCVDPGSKWFYDNPGHSPNCVAPAAALDCPGPFGTRVPCTGGNAALTFKV